MPERRPNVLLICVDQWRGDCLSVAGHPVVHTPYLDQLALDGCRFDRCYASVPTCIAARASLHTGLSQRSHGRVGYQDGVPWDYPVTLAGEFTRAGYQTQAVGKMHCYPERERLGFEHVLLHDGFLHFGRDRTRGGGIEAVDDYLPWLRRETGRPDADYFENGVNCNSVVARPWDKPEHLHPTNWVTQNAIDFLRRRDPRRPFLLFASYHRPHPPYDPPAWAFEQYVHGDTGSPAVGDWALAGPFAGRDDPRRPECAVGRVDPRVLHRARAGYYGHMSHIDHQVNRLVESLHEHRLRDDTVVCFVSDHGELMGDHHLFRKSLPYEGSARVPLILKGPKRLGIPAGTVRREVAELRDVMPTLLDCCGLAVPPSVEGRSLLEPARGQTPPDGWRSHVHGEHVWIGGQSVHYCTDGREKYVWFSGTGHEQLFDLAADPTELCDLAARPEALGRLSRWREVLVTELLGREEGFVDAGRLVPGRPVRPVLSAKPPLAVPPGSELA